MPFLIPSMLNINMNKLSDIKTGVVAPSVIDAMNYTPAGVANTKKILLDLAFLLMVLLKQEKVLITEVNMVASAETSLIGLETSMQNIGLLLMTKKMLSS